MKTEKQIDIIIPVHKKDLQILEYCIDAAKKKIKGARRVIIVSKEKYTNNAEWFDEALFPFSFAEVASYTGGSAGWYFQQLLKLYAAFVIPDLTQEILILDSDTVFFRNVSMFDGQGLPLYNISKDTHISRKSFDIDVASHIEKLLPAIAQKNLPKEFQELSGISHNMIFDREILRDLFAKVEERDKSGDPFYKIFLKHANHSHSASEYQLYFSFLLIFYKDKFRIRKLRYKNTADIDIKKYRMRFKYHYCSFHSYLRTTKRKSFRCIAQNFFGKIFTKLFCFEVWNIGIANCQISDFLTIPNQKIHWIKKSCKTMFRADPFGFVKNKNSLHIFYENYDFIEKKGSIYRLDLDEKFNILKDEVALKTEFHLSYPYIFSDGNKKFALVESYKSGKLNFCKVGEDLKFENLKTLLKSGVIDPSIIKFSDKYWMFFTMPDAPNEKLYIAFSDNLEGEWKMHPKNPVKSCEASARSGGEIFFYQGSLFRPAQNCTKTYGGWLVINKITTLSETDYEEKEEIQIFPNQLGNYSQGLHHISSLGNDLTLIDGKKKIFVLYKPLICALRLIKRLSR